MDKDIKYSKVRTRELAMMLIPAYLVILTLIFAVAFLYVYRFDIDQNNADFEVIPITSDSIGMDVYLARGATNQLLIDVYKTPHPEPFFNISFVYQTSPTGLGFNLVDDTGTTVSGEPIVKKDYETFEEWQYNFTNTSSGKYILQYTLGNDPSNASNVSIKRFEWKIPATSTS